MNNMESPILLIVLCLVVGSTEGVQVWSACSKSCGGGTKTRWQCFVSPFCTTVKSDCNTHPCVSGWGLWQPCSKTCGGGTRFKVDKCQLNSFATCPRTFGDCNTQPCKSLKGCPTGHRFRYEDPSSCCKVVSEKCGVDKDAKTRSRRVIGGKNAIQGDVLSAFQVAFVRRSDKRIHCGGSLLNKRWVLSAAHCFEFKALYANVYILLGSVTIKNPATGHVIREINETILHPNYAYPSHDVGLVKMNKDVQYSGQIQPICLPTSEVTPVDKTCVVTGWGLTQWHNRQSIQDHLKQVKVRTLPLDACIEGFKKVVDQIWQKLSSTQHICAGILSGGKGGCNGDGGSPLLCQRCSTCGWYIAGISSVGPVQCGLAGIPDAYTNVYSYQNWIRHHVSLSTTANFVC